MFKKFNKKCIHNKSNVKSSFQKSLKLRLLDQFGLLEPVIDQIISKKDSLNLLKCEDEIKLYSIENEIVIFEHDNMLITSLKIVHKYPDFFPKVRVDKGTITFIFSGANIMCPGLTSEKAELPEENLKEGTIITVYAEGKETSLGIGKLLMSIDDIKQKNKGVAIEMIHSLGDGLWMYKE